MSVIATDPVSLTASAAKVASQFSEHAASWDAERRFPREAFDLLHGAGLLSAPIDDASGFAGDADALHLLLLILKEVGRGDLSVGRIYEGHVNALQLVRLFGTAAQVERWRADARAGHVFGVWNTEAGDGVWFEPLDNHRLRLHGAKTFASGGIDVTRPIVPGSLDGGWQMALVPLDACDVVVDTSWWDPIGMRASVSYRVDFTGAIITTDDLLGAPGDYHRQPWFSGGAIRFAAVQLGGAEALLEQARSYLRALDRTTDPHQRARMGEAAILVESGNLWLRGAAEAVDLQLDRSRIEPADRPIAYANMTRLAIERVCLGVMEIVERSVGARGLLRPHPIERVVRDLTMYLRQPAPDAALAQIGEYTLGADGR